MIQIDCIVIGSRTRGAITLGNTNLLKSSLGSFLGKRWIQKWFNSSNGYRNCYLFYYEMLFWNVTELYLTLHVFETPFLISQTDCYWLRIELEIPSRSAPLKTLETGFVWAFLDKLERTLGIDSIHEMAVGWVYNWI